MTPVRMTTICTGLAILIAAAYFVTQETWDVFSTTGSFYDEQGKSLEQGRWDVSAAAIQTEAVIVNGKSYGYFGFAPALPRMILNRLAPSYFGRWSRCSMILGLASLVAAFFAFRALLGAPALFEPLLMLILLAGTTALFLCASSLTYHEAIMWGAALSVWAYIWYGAYLKTGRFVFLLWGALCGSGAFFSRTSSGSGPLACAGLILVALVVPKSFRLSGNWFHVKSPHYTGHATFLVLYLAAMIFGFLEVNHAKFGSYLDPVPIRYHVLYGPERLARIQGTLIHPDMFPAIAASYFDPTYINLSEKFPYVAMTTRSHALTHMDAVEPYASFPAAMPGALFLAGAGVWFLFRPAGAQFHWCVPILLAALASTVPTLSFVYISYRYQHDWFPFLFSAAMLGAVWVAQIQQRRVRNLVVAGLAVAAIWSVWANVAFVFELQRNPSFRF
jgi:hypothetical protein